MRLVSLVLLLAASAACSRAEKAPALEEQLRVLQELGVRLRPGITVDDLLALWDRAAYEAPPAYDTLISAMGAEAARAPYPRVSDDAWHFDTECVEGNGSYVAIAERIRGMARGDLPLEEIRDRVDLDTGVASMSFKLGGTTHRWPLRVDDDWVDASVFVKFDELLAERGKRLIALSWGGQDLVILMGSPERLKALRSRTGLDFAWMNP